MFVAASRTGSGPLRGDAHFAIREILPRGECTSR
jgi:hypothetical protein